MKLEQFKHINNLMGGLVFLFAACVYGLTMESTASLWDCGEFIAAAYKQQVVHPPGAPLFLMIGRAFTLLAMGNEELVALSMNYLSAICSALAVLFLFWSTVRIGRKLLYPSGGNGEVSRENSIVLLGAALVTALSATFLDSVWFSAVEGEVYSMSLMCTSLVFWAMLKWEEHADEPYADRWLLFIAFIMGCSIFIHWLNLLALPALTFIYYFRRYEFSRNGFILAGLISIAILGFFMAGIITGFVSIAAKIELAFVNGMGLPFNSGLIFSLAVYIGAIVGGLWWTKKNERPVLHNLLLALSFILIGYSTIFTIPIRSNSEPNVDMNSPRDLMSMDVYLKREQYGSRPFLRGYDYTAEITGVNKTGTKYQRGAKKYDDVGDRIEYEYKGKQVLFPRVYSTDANHKKLYLQWLGIRKGKRPNFGDNMSFFFRYQLGHMYFRYFMWNFAGRQNDEQGMGDRKDGNWISGIPFVDSFLLGASQSNLSETVSNHPSRNTYYFLPLLLGLLGMVFHATNQKKWAWVIFCLFFMTGIALVIQGNSPPVEPRERDYIFAASFFAFTIWLGIGVIALYDILKSSLKNGKTAAMAAVGLCLVVPLIMGFQNWDDHDRSDRFAARDFAANYLNTCAPNAIIFTQGDNDTYPLWYAQEVEGVRRDVRIVNLSLLGVDWYINQMRRKVNDAAPVPMTLTPDKVRGTKNDVVPYYQNPQIAPEGAYVGLNEVMKFVADDSPRSKAPSRNNLNYIPTRNFKINVSPANQQKLIADKAIAPEDVPLMTSELRWQLNKTSLYKNDLMVLDIINANNWERPIYFAISVSPSSYLGLEKYFQLEGLAYRLVPIEAPKDGVYSGRVNTEIMYNNLMNHFRFGNIKDADVFSNSDLRRMIFNFRGNFARLADALNEKGQTQKGAEVLRRSMEVMPDSAAPYNVFMYSTVRSFYATKDYESANQLTRQVATRLAGELKYYNSLSGSSGKAYKQDAQMSQNLIQEFIRLAKKEGQNDFAAELEAMIGS